MYIVYILDVVNVGAMAWKVKPLTNLGIGKIINSHLNGLSEMSGFRL